MNITNLSVETGLMDVLSIEELDDKELDALIELDTINEDLDLMDSEVLDEDTLDFKVKLDERREEYIEFYESFVKDIIRDFIKSNDLSGTVSFEARIKRDSSVKNSLKRKDIGLDDLKDYLGMRFIAATREDAYTVAGLFMMNNCIPKGREDDEMFASNRFNAYETRDYFKRPKLDTDGRVQYTGIHIFLEREGKKFEVQVHDLESYENANLTHEEYKMRKCTERTTEELEFEDLIQTLELE